jgi:hypothetical protein
MEGRRRGGTGARSIAGRIDSSEQELCVFVCVQKRRMNTKRRKRRGGGAASESHRRKRQAGTQGTTTSRAKEAKETERTTYRRGSPLLFRLCMHAHTSTVSERLFVLFVVLSTGSTAHTRYKPSHPSTPPPPIPSMHNQPLYTINPQPHPDANSIPSGQVALPPSPPPPPPPPPPPSSAPPSSRATALAYDTDESCLLRHRLLCA